MEILRVSAPVVLFSAKDTAGRNIVSHLENAIELPDSALYLEGLETSPSLAIVASRHSSKSGTPTLTCHSTGNFGPAEAGGNQKELGIAPALYLREALMNLKQNPPAGYEVSFEVTHHGPSSLLFPIMFVEVGSTEKEWKDMTACTFVAQVIEKLLNSPPAETPVAIGFGGGHYCRKFSKVSDFALGHICPKYSLPHLDAEMLQQMITRTAPEPKAALVEKKGLGPDKRRVLELLEETKLEVVVV